VHRVTILCVGTPKDAWVRDGCAEYVRRLRPRADVAVVELAPSKERDPARQAADESARLLIAAEKYRGRRWVLDERGLRATSAQFAELLGKARDAGDPLVILVGGAYGLTDAARQSGQAIRLSDMTFTHDMARLLLLEQLYRAGEILHGGGYHHG